MRIKKIKIKDFKGISLLEFNPKKINLIIGKNNTGKTSVLEAIDLLFNPDEINQRYPEHISDIISVGSKYSELTATLFYKKNAIKVKISKADEIEVIYNFKKDLIDVLIDSLKEGRKKNKMEITEETKHELLSKIDEWITPELRSNILKRSILLVKDEKNKIVKYQLRPSIEEVYTGLEIILENLYKYFKNKFGLNIFRSHELLRFRLLREIYRGGTKHKKSKKKEVILIKNLLRTGIEQEEKNQEIQKRILDIESIIKEHNLIENLERLDFDYVVFKDGSERISIPFSFLGDGFKAIVYLLWSLSSTNLKNKIVLLDEPETHMHPGYIKELIKILIKFSDELNIQFFITTHSGDFIDALFNENFSPEEQKYLEKELLILRMEKIDNQNLSEFLDYNEAKYTKDELLFDLRGN